MGRGCACLETLASRSARAEPEVPQRNLRLRPSVLSHKYLHKYAGAFCRWRRYSSSRGAYHCSSSCLASAKHHSAYLHTYLWDSALDIGFGDDDVFGPHGKVLFASIGEVVLQGFTDNGKCQFVPGYFVLGEQGDLERLVTDGEGAVNQLGPIKEVYLGYVRQAENGVKVRIHDPCSCFLPGFSGGACKACLVVLEKSGR